MGDVAQGRLLHREFPLAPVSQGWIGANVIISDLLPISSDDVHQGYGFEGESATVA
jgi:hypothetical protein